jgi:hypothetical protein
MVQTKSGHVHDPSAFDGDPRPKKPNVKHHAASECRSLHCPYIDGAASERHPVFGRRLVAEKDLPEGMAYPAQLKCMHRTGLLANAESTNMKESVVS